MLTAGVYFGSTTGPVFGGLIAQHLGWRAMFLFVGGLTLLVCALTLWKLRGVDWKEPRRARFDVLGSVVWAMCAARPVARTHLPPRTDRPTARRRRCLGLGLLSLVGDAGGRPGAQRQPVATQPSVRFLQRGRAHQLQRYLRHDLSHEPLSALQPGSAAERGRLRAGERHRAAGRSSPPSPAGSPTGCSPGWSRGRGRLSVRWASSLSLSWARTPPIGSSSCHSASWASVSDCSPRRSLTWS